MRIRLRRITSFLVLATGFAAAEPPPDFAWARRAGSADSDQGRSVAVDAAGNLYVTGFFAGTASFGATNLVSSGLEDVFVAKYSSDGTLLWARKAGGSSYDEGRGIAVDATGNAYVAGLFQGTATFTSTNVTSSGQSDVFVAKYNAQGALVWVRKAGGNSFDEAHAIAIDPGGNGYLTGSFDATATFGGTTLTNTSGSSDIFVAKFDPNGAFAWARRAGGALDDAGNGIALDAATNVFVTGSFATNAAFSSTNLSAAGAADVFVAKYSPNGALDWVRKAGGTNQDAGNAIAVDAGGSAFVTGQFRTAASFGGTNVSGNGADIFIARYDSAGNVSWVTKAGGNDAIYGDQGWGIRTDANGAVFVTGNFSGTANFGNTNITTTAFNDAFVAKYAPDGQTAWVTRVGGSGIDVGCALALDASNNVAVTGFFFGTTTAGQTNLTSSGLEDAFIVKLAATAPPRLHIARAGSNVVLSWPVNARGFLLESASAVPANSWTSVSPIATNGMWNVVTQAPSGTSKAFRLRAP